MRHVEHEPGSRYVNVFLRTYAHTTVPVKLTPADLARIAESIGTSVADLTLDDIRETAVERAHDNTPTLCHQCVGGTWADHASLDLSDEWAAADEYDSAASVNDVLVEVTERRRREVTERG